MAMRTAVALVLLAGFATGGCGQSVRRAPGEDEDETGGTGGVPATRGASNASGAAGASSLAAGGAGGSSSGGGGLGGSGAQPASTCASVTLTSAKPDPTQVLFVIEASDSLNEPASETTNSSRWELTQQALAPVLGALNDDVEAGVLYFPGRLDQDEVCFHPEFAVPPALVEGRQPALLTGSLYNVDPGGEATTDDAFEFALLARGTSVSRQAIVLVTDGAPDLGLSCQASETEELWAGLLGSVDHARSLHSVPTLVIGTYGSELARPMLSQLARTGGLASSAGCSDDGPTYCHLDLTTDTEVGPKLLDALTSIRTPAYTCEWQLPLPGDGTSPDLTDVVVTATLSSGVAVEFGRLEAGDACDAALGFYLTGEPSDPPWVSLCPAACELLVSDEASLTISAGCSPPPL